MDYVAAVINPYQPPSAAPYPSVNFTPGAPPPVVFWFKVYTGAVAFMFFLMVVLGLGMIGLSFRNELSTEASDAGVFAMVGGIYLIIGLAFMIASLVPFFVQNDSWVWVYNLVLICLGMTSCTIVFSIPLLIFWIREDNRAYYGRY